MFPIANVRVALNWTNYSCIETLYNTTVTPTSVNDLPALGGAGVPQSNYLASSRYGTPFLVSSVTCILPGAGAGLRGVASGKAGPRSPEIPANHFLFSSLFCRW